MRICENVYQIRIDFSVTEKVKRYVYVYLITGEKCYLVDSGVCGCEEIIRDYMNHLGRRIEEIDAIFLTHAHPDHIGGAAAIRRLSGCKIYASQKERGWIEEVELQWKERPIPNFHVLVKESVKVDEVIKEGDLIKPEDNICIRVLDTPGHSLGHVSYLWNEAGVLFSGDSIPDIHDFPILVDEQLSEATLEKMENLKGIRYCCPAWDRTYREGEWKEVLLGSKHYLQKFRKCVLELQYNNSIQPETEGLKKLGEMMGWNNMEINPLLKKSIESIK